MKNWAYPGLLTSQIISHLGPIFMHSLMAEGNRSKVQAWPQSEEKHVVHPCQKRLCNDAHLILSKEGGEEKWSKTRVFSYLCYSLGLLCVWYILKNRSKKRHANLDIFRYDTNIENTKNFCCFSPPPQLVIAKYPWPFLLCVS